MLRRLVSEGGHAWDVPTWQVSPQCPLLSPGGSPELEEEAWGPSLVGPQPRDQLDMEPWSEKKDAL